MPCYVERTGFTGAVPARPASPAPAVQPAAAGRPTTRTSISQGAAPRPATGSGPSTSAAAWSTSAQQANHAAAQQANHAASAPAPRLTAAVSRLAKQASIAAAPDLLK